MIRSSALLRAFALGIRSMLRYRWLSAVFLVATLSQGALQGLVVLTLREVLKHFSSGNALGAVPLVLSALLVLLIWMLRAGSTFVGEVVATRLAHRVENDTMLTVLNKMLMMPVRFFDKNSQGDLALAAYQDLKGMRTVTLDLGVIILSLSRLAGLAAVAWVMSPKLAIIGLVTIPLGVLPAYRLGERITQASRRERTAVATLYDSFLSLSSGIRIIRVNRGERHLMANATRIAEKLHSHVVHQSQTKSLSRFLLEVVSGVGLIGVLIAGGQEVGSGRLGWQDLLSLLIAVMAVYAPVLSLLQVYGNVRAAAPNLERVTRLLDEIPELQDAPNARRLAHAPATIELRDVGFAYEGRAVLDSVSVTFHQGETIGVVGPSGSGKSTLLALLLRFYDPTRGSILLDGVDLRDIRHSDLMEQSAIVLQEPFLFIDTVANNIRWARPSASMEEVIAAAKAANIHDEIMQMEKGYETMLGRHKEARGISTGQKQRLCIAAALLKNAPILFLDEATSNLDSVSERAVQHAVERLMAGRTTFVIAHRLSTLRSADRILVLDDGRLVGLGTHAQLLENCLTYQRLWRYQAGDRLPPWIPSGKGSEWRNQPGRDDRAGVVG